MYLLSPVKYKMTYRVLAHNNVLLLQFTHYMFRNSSFCVEDILEECVCVCMYIYLSVLFRCTALSEQSCFIP